MKALLKSEAARLILACGLVLAATPALALTVRGARPCGKWIEDKKESILSVAQNGWLMGYLSGLAVSLEKDVLKDVDAKSLYLWVDNYCQRNPLDNTADAGDKLFQELERRMNK